MKKIQTPQKKMNAVGSSAEKQSNRRLKHFPNSNLITKKRLSTAFSSVSEDSSNFSPISKISYDNNNDDITTLSLEEASTEESGISSVLTDCFGAFELNSATFSSVDLLIAENSPTKVQPKVHDSIIADPRYRKLMNEITKHVMEELYESIQPKDSKCIDHVLHAKNRMLFPCLCIWIIVVFALFFFTSDIYCPPSGQFPT
ncbi:PREDICTED: uncharacterized protein LOC109338399 [Lupinus angustifolius]|uniref:uncharacterized protein LOC109338399 n=1 Tax=Lupinus angustifolius TaxID=3871 RepID=UPI00092F12B7|nr:PREDICTED: uncharacterized protein LOC109338399 [Lupinus angustifolius]